MIAQSSKSLIVNIISIFLDDESDRKGKRNRSRIRSNSGSRQNSRPSSRLNQNASKREELPSQDEISKLKGKRVSTFQ